MFYHDPRQCDTKFCNESVFQEGSLTSHLALSFLTQWSDLGFRTGLPRLSCVTRTQTQFSGDSA